MRIRSLKSLSPAKACSSLLQTVNQKAQYLDAWILGTVWSIKKYLSFFQRADHFVTENGEHVKWFKKKQHTHAIRLSLSWRVTQFVFQIIRMTDVLKPQRWQPSVEVGEQESNPLRLDLYHAGKSDEALPIRCKPPRYPRPAPVVLHAMCLSTSADTCHGTRGDILSFGLNNCLVLLVLFLFFFNKYKQRRIAGICRQPATYHR